MSNELDEVSGEINKDGREVTVINKQITATVGTGSTVFEISLWVVPLLFSILFFKVNIFIIIAVGVIPGVAFLYMKSSALSYLRQLEQKIQADASQIDNYQEQRVIILQNVVGLLQKSIELDKDVMKTVAAVRSGANSNQTGDNARNQTSQQIDGGFSKLNVAFEAYPDLKAQATIADAMQQNSYLQKEITAARTLYNDRVSVWNQDIFAWPTKQIVAAKAGYTTRIPFIASSEIKSASKGVFF